MKNYLKLTNFEFSRFSKLYGSLILFTLLSQLIAVFITARNYMSDVQTLLYEDQLTESVVLGQMGPLSMAYVVTRMPLFMLSIALCVGVMFLYCLFIWYRDWNGKNTFIYRLLMLPTERMSLFFSKLTVIFVSVLGLIGTEIILLTLGNQLLKMLVPAPFMADLTVHEITSSVKFIEMLIPSTFTDFLLYYGAGLTIIIVLFTAILMERSFRMRGLALGIAYCFTTALIFLSPALIEVRLQVDYFLPSEMLLLLIALGVLISGTSIGLSRYLLNHKITV